MRHNLALPTNQLGTIEEIRALKKAEIAARKQRDARATREGVKNLVWLFVGSVLMFGILFST